MAKSCKECKNNVFSGGYCKYHQYLRPSSGVKPSRRKLTPKKYRHIKAVSSKHQKALEAYANKYPIFLKNHPLCEANIPQADCRKVTMEIHHMKGRGRYLLDETTWLGVCRNCHHWIEMHPKEAKELNFSQSRLT